MFFTSTSVENLVVSGKTATFEGTGKWLKKKGFTYEVTVTDTGPDWLPLDERDIFSIVIRDGAGTVVYSTTSRLAMGNLKVR